MLSGGVCRSPSGRQSRTVFGPPLAVELIVSLVHLTTATPHSQCLQCLRLTPNAPGPPLSPTVQFIAHIWDTRSGKRLRTFDGPQAEYAIGGRARPDGSMKWPSLRWSGNAEGPRYLAHMKANAIRCEGGGYVG